MLLFVLLLWALYLSFLIVLIVGWGRGNRKGRGLKQHSITVLVPFRNEENQLAKIVIALQNQIYSNFSVMFINDHSTDKSVDVLRKSIKEVDEQFSLLEMKEGYGKKNAILLGVQYANSEIIVTTDADCQMGQTWLERINQEFEDNVKLVAGPVKFLTDGSFFQEWQAQEFSSLIGTSGALAQFNYPVMCNGANLAYRRETFEEVKGFEGIMSTPSGDDELLMNKIRQHYPNGIRFVQDTDALVTTDPARDWGEFMNQRRRWASKWKVSKRPLTISLSFFVFLFHLGFVASIWLTIVQLLPVWFLGTLLGAKLILEWNFLKRVLSRMNEKPKWKPFLVSQIFYSFYAILFGLLANFGKYQWKGRSYKI